MRSDVIHGTITLIDIGYSDGAKLSGLPRLDSGVRLRRFDGHRKLSLVFIVDGLG